MEQLAVIFPVGDGRNQNRAKRSVNIRLLVRIYYPFYIYIYIYINKKLFAKNCVHVLFLLLQSDQKVSSCRLKSQN